MCNTGLGKLFVVDIDPRGLLHSVEEWRTNKVREPILLWLVIKESRKESKLLCEFEVEIRVHQLCSFCDVNVFFFIFLIKVPRDRAWWERLINTRVDSKTREQD